MLLICPYSLLLPKHFNLLYFHLVPIPDKAKQYEIVACYYCCCCSYVFSFPQGMYHKIGNEEKKRVRDGVVLNKEYYRYASAHTSVLLILIIRLHIVKNNNAIIYKCKSMLPQQPCLL